MQNENKPLCFGVNMEMQLAALLAWSGNAFSGTVINLTWHDVTNMNAVALSSSCPLKLGRGYVCTQLLIQL